MKRSSISTASLGRSVVIGLGVAGLVLVTSLATAGDPPKVQTPPKIQPIRVSVAKSTVRTKATREKVTVHYYDRSGQFLGRAQETQRKGPEEIGKTLSIELRNIGSKAYSNLRVAWTVQFQVRRVTFGPSGNVEKSHLETRSGTNAVNLPLGGKGEVVTTMVEGEIEGYKVEVFDGDALLAVVSDGMRPGM
jgi:hypothetical protein